jgi:Heparinase II/III-like protein/Heparinase II/III N-terminus
MRHIMTRKMGELRATRGPERIVQKCSRRFAVGVVILMVASCSERVLERPAVTPEPQVTEPASALPLGRESMYRILNVGNLRAADRLLDDVWALPRHRPVRLQWPLAWTEDPFQEPYWRFLFYSLRPTSDLLWAYYTTGDTRYRDKLVQILRSFLMADSRARRLSRRTFDNRHTAAFRAMVLVNSYGKLKRSRDLPANLDRQLASTIRRLGVFLADPQNFEEEHNHGFTQAAALLLVAENFPRAPQSAAWRVLAKRRLDDLLRQTVGFDGVQIENSPFYHFYVLNFLHEIAAWAKAHRIPLTSKMTATIHKMMRYATYITLPNGHIPLLGASVDLDVRRNRPDLYTGLAADYPEFEFVRTGGGSGRPPRQRNVLFASSGQSIMASKVSSTADLANQTQLVFDVGPYRTSHSQLDTLSMTYYAAGRLLLPDSGLFTYQENTRGFAYFHGTRAHNTVVVDGADQRVGRATKGRTLTGPTWSYQSGAHTLYPGVVHRRSILLLGRDLTLVVDRLASATPHRYTQTWHLFPGATIVGTTATVAVDDQTGRRVLTIDQARHNQLTLRSRTGARTPMQGWISSTYGNKTPNTALEYHASGTTSSFITLLATGPAAEASRRLVSTHRGKTLTVAICAGTTSYTARITNQAQPGEHLHVTTNSCPAG